MKQCKQCSEEKPLTEYYKTGKWYLSKCKPCHKKACLPANRKYHKTNKGKASVKKHQTSKQGVYGIFSNQTCLYVGESGWLNSRIPQHKANIFNKITAPQVELYLSIRQHDNIEIRILEETPNHKTQERIWIDYLNPLYNKA